MLLLLLLLRQDLHNPQSAVLICHWPCRRAESCCHSRGHSTSQKEGRKELLPPLAFNIPYRTGRVWVAETCQLCFWWNGNIFFFLLFSACFLVDSLTCWSHVWLRRLTRFGCVPLLSGLGQLTSSRNFCGYSKFWGRCEERHALNLVFPMCAICILLTGKYFISVWIVHWHIYQEMDQDERPKHAREPYWQREQLSLPSF